MLSNKWIIIDTRLSGSYNGDIYLTGVPVYDPTKKILELAGGNWFIPSATLRRAREIFRCNRSKIWMEALNLLGRLLHSTRNMLRLMNGPSLTCSILFMHIASIYASGLLKMVNYTVMPTGMLSCRNIKFKD